MSAVTGALHLTGRSLADLERFVRDDAGWRDLTTELGWHAVPLPPAISALATPIAAVVSAVETWDASPAALERMRQAVVAVVDAFEQLSTLDLGAAGLGADLAEAAIDLAVLGRLAREYPVAHAALVVVGFVEVRYVREPARPGFHRRRLRWDNLAQLLDRPTAAWAAVFGWGSDGFVIEAWTSAIAELFGACGIDAAVERLPPEVVAHLAAEGLDVALPVGCTIRFVDATTHEIGVRVVAVRDAGVDAVALVPSVPVRPPRPCPCAPTLRSRSRRRASSMAAA